MLRAQKISIAGLSLVSVALVIVVLAVIAVLLIPRVRERRLVNIEAQAARNLKALAVAETVEFHPQAVVDQDADTIGEYGLLGELCGELAPRAATTRGKAFLSPAFATGGRDGVDDCAVVGGYVYRVFLPCSVEENDSILSGDDKTLGGTPTQPGATLTDVEAIDLQEKHFVAYAWPLAAGETGRLAYAVTEKGEVVSTPMKAKVYSGRGAMGAPNAPAVNAAFTGAPYVSSPANGIAGNDGNVWSVVSLP